jgi:Histidine phosphatase superfamily (branch 1)
VNGTPKRVNYWAARADDHAPPWRGTKEIDQVMFLPAADAIRQLTHPRDADVVAALRAAEIRTVAFVVLRHTKAVERASWNGPDALRPLNDRGTREARELVAPFTALGLTRVVSSDAVRCVDSVRPYADATDASLELHPALSDELYESQPLSAEKLTRALLADGTRTVVCSQPTGVTRDHLGSRRTGAGTRTVGTARRRRLPGHSPPERGPRRRRVLRQQLASRLKPGSSSRLYIRQRRSSCRLANISTAKSWAIQGP